LLAVIASNTMNPSSATWVGSAAFDGLSHHAQATAVLDHSRALPQGDGSAAPAFARGAVRCECNLVVLDTHDVLHDAFTVKCPSIDAEGKVGSQRAHLHPLLFHSSSASRFTADVFSPSLPVAHLFCSFSFLPSLAMLRRGLCRSC